MCLQAASPLVPLVIVHSKSDVQRSSRPVTGNVRAWTTAPIGIEEKQHTVATTEEDVPACLATDKCQTQYIAIERFGHVQLIHV